MLFLTPFLTAYCLVLSFLTGAAAASFLGCMGWRMCNGESVLKGRSHCDSCGHVLSARDLIPILSYVRTKGRCTYCKEPIGSINFYGEIIVAVAFVLTTMKFDISVKLVPMLLFICILYLVSVTDIYAQVIPDGCLLVAVLIRLIYYVVFEEFQWQELLMLLVDGIAVSVPLLFLVLLMERLWQREVMGGGDIKLLFVTGLYIGWANNLLALFFACIFGIVVGLIQQKKTENVESLYFPFGPSIALGTFLSMLVGEPLISAYMSLFI
ncbi:MAG: prepilin peptidase [Agathobacter sp.]|nr:prepilin peptidase [Agathobacter sp.]